jgi:hypothetical protein
MRFTPHQLVGQLSTTVDQTLAKAVVQSYVEMQQRFLAGDWKPTELDGGRLCEAISRCLLQLDTGVISHTDLPGSIRDTLLAKNRAHNLIEQDRRHISSVIQVVYKFRSDRGPVHISPIYTANFMDSMLVIHAGKWIFAELLRIAWNADRQTVSEIIAQLVQLEHSLVHELDGKPLVLAKGISAPDEVLLLLNHASNNRLTRAELREQASNQKPQTVNAAISRLIKQKEVRPVGEGEIALTPNGQKRLMEEILPKLG